MWIIVLLVFLALLTITILVWFRYTSRYRQPPDLVKDASIDLVDSRDRKIPAKITYEVRTWTRGDLLKTECLMTLSVPGKEFSAKGHSVFHAFFRIRKKLESEGLLPLCYGASRNAILSGMSLDLSHGEVLHRAEPAYDSDVHIFDWGPDVEPITASDQERLWRE